MPLLKGDFGLPLPAWIGEIRADARTKIVNASFASACRAGDVTVMRGLILGIWPFVNEFPKSIIRGAERLPNAKVSSRRELLNMLLHRNSLAELCTDEENHRQLWLDTGESLGLLFPRDYALPILPETKRWIDAVNENVDPFTLFVRFAAIEIIAETVSVDFLSSPAFASLLGERGCEWFRVHAEHEGGMSHEEFELRKAFGFLGREPTNDQTNAVVQAIVDLFVAAAEASAKLI